MNTTIQLRIDKATKTRAQKILSELGLDMSSAMKLFLLAVSRTKSIPFEIKTVNGFSPAQEARLLKEARLTKKSGRIFENSESLMKDLLA